MHRVFIFRSCLLLIVSPPFLLHLVVVFGSRLEILFSFFLFSFLVFVAAAERPPPTPFGMKFRAKMQDVLYMREFQAIIATLAKLAKECVMILGQERMHFIINEDHSSTSLPLVWASIAAKDYFPEYKMTPARPDQEFIVLAMSAVHLGRALAVLRSGTTSTVHSCKLKLKMIQFPCLSVVSSVISPTSAEPREVEHDVPATIIPASDWPAYVLPKVPAAQIVLGLPSLRLMRSLIDKLKNISPSLVFHGSAVGELNLVSESEMATITTRFNHLLPIRERDPSRGRVRRLPALWIPAKRRPSLVPCSCPMRRSSLASIMTIVFIYS